MRRLRPPFRLWPLEHHAVLALLLVAASVLGGRWLVGHSHLRLLAAQGQLHDAQERLRREEQAARMRSLPQADFTQRLPSSTHVDEVVRQATRYAEAHGIQLANVALERKPASAADLAQWRVSVSLQGAYPALKAWLADLQARNEALAVDTLLLRRGTGPLLEGQVVLLLFTRD